MEQPREISFPSGKADCAGWWWPPASSPGPAIVLGHGLGGVYAARLDAYARRFHAAGYGVLAFDYRGFGASGGTPRQVVSIKGQLADWTAALAWVRARPDVDPERVAVWGTSFAGGHVVTLAARDARIAALVAQVPFMDGLVNARTLPPWQALRLTAAGLRDALRALIRRTPHYMPIAGPPGAVAALTTPDAQDGYRAMFPAGETPDERIAARIALTVPAYRPVRAAARVGCPALLCLADEDRLTPTAPALRAAAAMRRAEVRHYPTGHFGLYDGELFERAVADQLAFLQRHLSPRTAGAAPAAA
jgi:dienelactone hydrolase